ncbi:MAG: FKBP-type peptidyl-prolyl cis-trans isomerase [Caldilineaceae bacterium]
MKQHLRTTLALPIALLVILLLAACGTNAPTTEATSSQAGDQAATEQPAAEAESAEAEATPASDANAEADQPAEASAPFEKAKGESTVTDSGLEIIVTEAGSGPKPEPGSVVVVHYTGMLEDGTVFDSSVTRGEPISFPLGQGRVIPGWDEGIALLNQGSKAQLIIPSELGYGAQGAGGVIPPNATLIFDVELVDVLAGSPANPAEVAEADYTTTDSGLKYYDLEVGAGEAAKTGDVVVVNYTGWLTDGVKFDSSLDRGQPFSFPLGQSRVITGWDEGVTSMQPGGKRQLVIPAELAYGDQGAGGVIPPGATLIFDVELVEVREGAPAAPTEVAAEDYTTTDSGLQYYDFTVGDGATPSLGQNVTVNYTGWLEDGTKFDSSLDRGQPFSFVIGMGQVIPGWDEGVMTMQVGGKRQLRISPELGYGAQGAGGVIPPNATLIFEVELLDVQ